MGEKAGWHPKEAAREAGAGMTLEEIESAICKAGSDNHEFFGGTWTGGYYIQQDQKEFAQLVKLLQGFQFRNYLAIGIAAGGVERFICDHVDIGNLTVIDNGEHPNHKFWKENKPKDFDSFFVNEIIGDSHSLSTWDKLEKAKFNLVGIDGDHSPQGVLQDWELVQPYLAPGALVWFHDIKISEPGQTGARKLWSRLKREQEVLLETNGKFGIGVLCVT